MDAATKPAIVGFARSSVRFLARFGRDDAGMATTVEFALIAGPFFGLLFGIIELGLILLLTTTLENATYDTARRIRTGELQQQGNATAATFASSICSSSETLSWLGPGCSANLSVDVRTFPQFAAINAPDPVTNNSFDKTKLTFQPGGPGDIVLVRAYYPWTLIAPGLDGAVQQLNGGQVLISSTVTFRNEPYQ